MFSKINFTYKNHSQTSKSYLILKEQFIRQKIKENETKSVVNCLDTKNKVDPKKVENVSDVFIESRETTNNISNINTNIEIKLNDSSSINNGMINDINNHEIESTQALIKHIEKTRGEQNRFINNLTKPIEQGNFDSTFSLICDINPKIELTLELIKHIEKSRGFQNQFIDHLSQPIEKGKIDSTFSLIYDNNNNNNDMLMNESFLQELEIPNPFNVGRIKNRGVQILNNVYQSSYFSGKVNGTGFGDFIRGCYFMLEFCSKYNFGVKIVFNNCISKFLNTKTHNLDTFGNILEKTQFFEYNNVRNYRFQDYTNIILEPIKDTKHIMANFVDFVVKQPQYSNNVFMLCNCYPITEPGEPAKEYMRQMLQPTNEMNDIIQKTMNELSIASKQYNVIHIRSGDSYLVNKTSTFNNSYINKLIVDIKLVVSNDINGNYLLMADNNHVKNIIKQFFPNFRILNKPITHFGEGVVLEEEKVKNTLLDFYLLSRCKHIFSYSSYKHGSGFSYWCAKTYNIPYICKFIE